MRDRFLTSSGSRIYLEDHGAGLPILAIHGLGGGAWFFSGLSQRLAGECRLVAVDLPGTGRSVSVGAPSVASWVKDLGELIEGYLGAPALVLGHSMGTIIALEAAASWPALMRGAIFAGGLPEPLPHIKERLAARAGIVDRDGMEGTGAVVAAANFAAGTMARAPELVGLFEWLFEAQEPQAYAHCCRLLSGASAVHLVEQFSLPALSISGYDDQYAPPERVTDFIRRVDGGTQELLRDCGHFPFLEQPDAFARLVRAFIRDL